MSDPHAGLIFWRAARWAPPVSGFDLSAFPLEQRLRVLSFQCDLAGCIGGSFQHNSDRQALGSRSNMVRLLTRDEDVHRRAA